MRVLLGFRLLVRDPRRGGIFLAFARLVLRRRALSRSPSPPLGAIVGGCLAVGKGESRRGTRQDVRHADDEEGDQKRGAEQGGGEARAGVEMRRGHDFFFLERMGTPRN